MFTSTKMALGRLVLSFALQRWRTITMKREGLWFRQHGRSQPAYHRDIFGSAGTARAYGFTARPPSRRPFSFGQKSRNR